MTPFSEKKNKILLFSHLSSISPNKKKKTKQKTKQKKATSWPTRGGSATPICPKGVVEPPP
jgi:hypothetical protein